MSTRLNCPKCGEMIVTWWNERPYCRDLGPAAMVMVPGPVEQALEGMDMTVDEKLHHIETALRKVRSSACLLSEEYLMTSVSFTKVEIDCIEAALQIAAAVVELMREKTT